VRCPAPNAVEARVERAVLERLVVFQRARGGGCTGRREGYISYRGSRYSVPPEHAERPLLVKEGADGRLRVYSSHRQIIEHLLAEKPGSVITTPGHAEAVRTLARTRGGNGARSDRRGASRSNLLRRPPWPEVQVRPLAVYDEALGLVAVGT